MFVMHFVVCLLYFAPNLSQKKTNQVRFQNMVKFMEDNPELAVAYKSLPKCETQEKWELLKIALNNVGPPERSTKEWKKVD